MSENNNPADQAASYRSSAIPRPLSAGALRIMAEAGTLSPAAYEAALRFLGVRPGPRQWLGFWQRILSSWGALFFAAGVICFFAYNWAEMRYFAKFALIASLIFAAGLIALWRGLDSLPGKLALLLAALGVGPLLAVYGQVYQTGADAWELFRAWALVVLPLALAGRQAALWLLLWLLGSAWGGVYLGGLSMRSHDLLLGLPGMPEFLFVQAVFLAGWEVASFYWHNRAGQEWLKAAWFPRIVGFALLAVLTGNLAWMILDGPRSGYYGYSYLLLPPGQAYVALYGVLLLAGWLWYRKKRPDLFMISCGLFSLAALLVCALVRADMFRWDVGTLLVWGLMIAGITAGCGFLLRRLHQKMEAERDAKLAMQASATGSFGQSRPPPSWDGLWDRLRAAHLLVGEAPPIPVRSATPWYIAVQLAAGGWIAALFLICFLVVFLYEILGIRSSGYEFPLAIGGVIFLTVAGLLMRRETIFTAQFALALAIAGICALSGAVGSWAWGNYRLIGPLAISLVIAASYPLMRNASYRHLAAVCGLLLFIWGLDVLVFGDPDILWNYSWRHGEGLHQTLLRIRVSWIIHIVWYALLCAAMGYGWLAEHKWRTNPRLYGLLAPLLHSIYYMLWVSVLISLGGLFAREFWPFGLLRSAAGIGIGAGIGLVYCAYVVSKTLAATAAARSFCLGFAVLALAGGWFLPGVSIGLLGLALGRYRGDKVTLGVTIAALVAYFFSYYYNLNTTLLYKSITLMASGAGLWAVGICLRLATKQNAAVVAGGGHA